MLELSTVAYHLNDSITNLFFKVDNDHVLYKRLDTGGAFYSNIKISYNLINQKESRVIIDTNSVFIKDKSFSEFVPPKILYATTQLTAIRGNNYVLEIEVEDVNKKIKNNLTLLINKVNDDSKQNFLIRKNDTVTFTNSFVKHNQISLAYSKQTNQLVANLYRLNFGAAPPPFSSKTNADLNFKPDSSFNLSPRDSMFWITMPEYGFFNIQSSPTNNQGINLFTAPENFPAVSSSLEMIECARYIMNKTEYEECKMAEDTKAAIDKFWLAIGGSNERARELLRRYYSRVKEANKLFTSYKEGWKSDRGIIFIVFGEPVNRYRTSKDEAWVYGNEANPASLRFVFKKNKNQFSDNDYVLERSLFYKEAYYQAVDYWRQGNVYLEQKR